jgi:hypothetical protein
MGRESHRKIHAPSFCFLVPKLLHLLPLILSPPPPSRSLPPLTAMASNLVASRLRWENNLRKLRWLLGWQSSEFDVRIRCGSILLGGLWPSEFIFFTSYALSGFILSFSSFFMLLENNGLHLNHLSLHSITLVVIFVHLCEMYVGMRPSVRLFQLFHLLRSSKKRASPSAAATSSTRPRVRLCTSLLSAPTSGTAGEMIG